LANLLFICSKNQWRSPTAELLFTDHPTHRARSAGTSDRARIKVNQKLIDWADVIFAMERRHRDILKQQLNLAGKTITVLNIDDIYQFGDPELIAMLSISLRDYL
jgi:predicted protein tyrosine phosphatase